MWSNLYLSKFLKKSMDYTNVCRNGFSNKDFSKNPVIFLN